MTLAGRAAAAVAAIAASGAFAIAVRLASADSADTVIVTTSDDALELQALSDDGARALFIDEVRNVPQRLRVTTVDSGKLVSELALPMVGQLTAELLGDGRATTRAVEVAVPGLAAELRAVGPMIAGFPLGSAERLAAAPDGRHVAFVVTDSLYTAVDGKVVTRVAVQAAYHPLFTPNGKALLFTRYLGHTDETFGYYGLFVTSSDGTAIPRALAGTTGIEGPIVVTARGSLRIVVSAEPMVATCVVEVSLTAPYATTKLGCLPDDEHDDGCELSPRGTWLACATSKRGASLSAPGRLRTMEVATGKIAIDRDGSSPAAISEAGVVVLSDAFGIRAIDATGSSWSLSGRDAFGSLFRTATQLVVQHDDTVQVLDTRAP